MIEFCELFAKTNYSFLEGASFPEEMVLTAAAEKYRALGICDRNGVYGIPRAHAEAKNAGFPILVGAEVLLEDATKIYLLAQNREGYGNLCEMLTAGHARREQGDRDPDSVRLAYDELSSNSAHLFAFVSGLGARETGIIKLKEIFQKNFYLIAHQFFDHQYGLAIQKCLSLAQQFELECVVSNFPLFHLPDRKRLQDVLVCIRHTCPIDRAGFHLKQNGEQYLKPIAKLAMIFKEQPRWLQNTVVIAERCHFNLDELTYSYPMEWIPPGETTQSYLEKLTWQGAKERYGESQTPEVRRQISHELALISKLHYADYFLTVWDIVEYAKRSGILCQGRGSAANSAVCYVLGITSIDPIRMKLLFERFISQERKEPPDIDIDFEHERREEVIQYIYTRYGRERAAITAEVICFRKRSSIREVGKVFEIPLPVLEKYIALTHRRSSELEEAQLKELIREVPPERWRYFFEMVNAISGYPRHLGTHVGGFVLTNDKLTRHVPVENAAMPDRTILQWDKDDLDILGFVKVDILGLGILTVIRKSFEYLKTVYGKDYTLATVPAEDPKVYELAQRADTVGVFQIESRAQMNMLPRLKPKNFYDLVVEIALVRPGPVTGEMVHPYLRRRSGEEPITYAHPDLKDILERTCGVPLFQEQIMKISMVVAGFTPGEADQLRRAMGSWKRNGKEKLLALGERFRQGMLKRGVSEANAQQIFGYIEGFAEYGFPESHAASFAIFAYVTCWLKAYYPDVFLAGLLNSQPMGFYPNYALIHDGKRHGVEIIGIDINRSIWDNQLIAPKKILLGFREIRGLSRSIADALIAERDPWPYLTLELFIERLKAKVLLTKRDLFFLAAAQAFDVLNLSRRDALWKIQGYPLRDSPYLAPEGGEIELPQEKDWEKITLDYEAQGVSLFSHPMAHHREQLRRWNCLSSQDLKKLRNKNPVIVAGMVVCRQMPPAAKGVFFLTLEDEKGFINAVVWNKVYEIYRVPLLSESFLMLIGHVQKDATNQVIHIIVDSVQPLLERDFGRKLPSKDFG